MIDSNKINKEIDNNFVELKKIEKHLRDKRKEKTGDKDLDDTTFDVDRAVLILTYVSSDNLVKHSKDLTKLTIALFITSVALIIFAAQQFFTC
ncbi:hypothetical protein ACFLTB_04140 [Chloroflexota bacterium]